MEIDTLLEALKGYTLLISLIFLRKAKSRLDMNIRGLNLASYASYLSYLAK